MISAYFIYRFCIILGRHRKVHFGYCLIRNWMDYDLMHFIFLNNTQNNFGLYMYI